MADIELVIKIPENEYQNILLTGKASFCAVNAIEAGTILPKGHGRIGDLDALEDFCNGREIGNSLTGEILVTVGHYKDGDEINKKLFSEEIAPTIIEADKS